MSFSSAKLAKLITAAQNDDSDADVKAVIDEYVAGLKSAPGGKRAKKARDPNAPKRAASAWLEFSNSNRARVKKENPEAAFGEIAKILSAEWKALPEKKKAPYEAKAVANKKAYEAAKKKYDASGGAAAASGDDDSEEAPAPKKGRAKATKGKAPAKKAAPAKKGAKGKTATKGRAKAPAKKGKAPVQEESDASSEEHNSGSGSESNEDSE